MNAEELTTLTEKTGGLQAYLTGRPQPGGPTRYELIKEHVRSVRGQQAADSLDQHLAEFEKVMQLGLDLDQIHKEAEKGLPRAQEAPQEAVEDQGAGAEGQGSGGKDRRGNSRKQVREAGRTEKGPSRAGRSHQGGYPDAGR